MLSWVLTRNICSISTQRYRVIIALQLFLRLWCHIGDGLQHHRFLRLCVSSRQPLKTLHDIVLYYRESLKPVLFTIKKNCFTEGAKHFIQIKTISQSMRQRIKSETNKVLSRNSFFVYAENILIAMIYDL